MAVPKRERFAVSPWKIIAGAVFLLIVIGVLAVWMRNRSLKSQIAEEIEKIREEGQPVAVQELAKEYYSVPPDENAAPILLEAFAQIDSRWPEDLRSFLSSRSPADAPVGEEAEKAFDFVEANEEALKLLDEALGRSRASFEFRWGWPMDPLDHLRGIRDLANMLALRARLICEERPAEAAKDVQRIAGLARLMEHEHLLMSYLVRSALLHSATLTIEYMLNSEVAMDHDTLEMLRIADEAKIDIRPVLITERSLMLQSFSSAMGLDPAQAGVLAESGILLHDNFAYLQCMGEAVEAANDGFPKALVRVREIADALETEGDEISRDISNFKYHRFLSFKLFTGMQFPSYVKAFERTASILARLRLTELALTLEQQRLAKEEYPPDLQSLSGMVPESALIDPFTGTPLRYRQDEEGFTLYSVGEDGTDEGGTPRPKETSRRDEPYDLVFRVDRVTASN